MAEGTRIEWAHHTHNEWSGCTRVSEACRYCYAEALAARFPSLGHWGPGAQRRLTSEANRRKPLRWQRWVDKGLCGACGHNAIFHMRGGCADRRGEADCGCLGFVRRPRVFTLSLGDWLDPEVPAEWLAGLLRTIALTPGLDWLLLTKRPEQWEERLHRVVAETHAPLPDDPDVPSADMLASWWLDGQAPPNVWFGVTAEDQDCLDRRWGHAEEIPAAVTFFSAEPLLGPLRLPEQFLSRSQRAWVIAGGESGREARPMHPDWARSLRDQCVDAGVPFLFKQWGAWRPVSRPQRGLRVVSYADEHRFDDRTVMERVGKKKAGRLLDGRTWDEVPIHG